MSAFTAEGFMFTIMSVNIRQPKVKLPVAVSIGSLIIIISLTLLTDPIGSILWAALFFVALFILLISLAATLAILQIGEISPTMRKRIILGSGILSICLMLRSAGSLNLVDVLVLILIFSGSVFYFSRR